MMFTGRAMTAASIALLASAATLAAPAFAQDTPPVTTDPATPQQTTTTVSATQTTTTTTVTPAPQAQTGTASSNQLPLGGSLTVDNSGSRYRLGPEAGIYMPINNKTRNAFGPAWFNLGVGIGPLPKDDARGSLTYQIRLFGSYNDSNRDVFLAPIGLNYRWATNTTSKDARPYVGIGANYIVTHLQSDIDNVNIGYRGTYGGNLMAGVSFKQRGYIQAQYFAMAPVRGYDLSGLSMSLGYRF